jgi:hypothetical protein
MSLLSKGLIHLDDSGNENAGSDVEEVVQWDIKLRQMKTFMTAVAILAGHRFESPNSLVHPSSDGICAQSRSLLSRLQEKQR